MRGFELTAWRDPRSIRKTMRGSGMVSPVKSVTVSYQSGRTEELIPGVSRLSPDHELVRMRPALFRPCDTEDKATATRMLELAGTPTRMLEQTRTQRSAAPRTYGRHQLRPRKQQPRSKLR